MSTSEAVAAGGPLVDGRFARRFVAVCGAVPGGLLVWDAFRGQLGVNEVNFAIRTTGMLGLAFLTLALLVTPLRRMTGWNPIIAARRNLGLYAFAYIAAHFAIFLVYDRDGSVASTIEEIVSRVYLWFGAAALLFMIPLALTSTDAMVTRLGARRWKRLHRLAYAAAVSGAIHFYLLVKADVSLPLAFAAAIGVLLAYRVGRHYVDLRGEVGKARANAASSRAASGSRRRSFWSGELVVARIFQESHDVKTFRLAMPGGGPLPFDHVAGQYLNLALTVDGRRVNRSYTIASSPTRSASCEITVKRISGGIASRHLHDSWREGTVVRVSAPAGRFVFAGHEARRAVLIAGGVGITPMMSVVRSLTDRSWPGPIHLLYSVKTRGDIVFESELAHLQSRFGNLHVRVTLSDDPDAEWDGARGRITRELVEAVVPDLDRGPVLLCGPAPMMIAMREMLVEMGVPDGEILEETFASPPPGADAADDAPAVPVLKPSSDPASVRFQRAGRSTEIEDNVTVLEAAEGAGIAIPFECRSGICGQCKTRLVSGHVAMEMQDALTAGDRARGLILACQARPIGDVVVDA